MGYLVVLSTLVLISVSYAHRRIYKPPPAPELVYSWVALDFDFGSEARRQQALDSNEFIPDNIQLSQVESYQGEIFVTCPRFLSGTPASLNKVVEKTVGRPVLQPFPDLESNTLGDCDHIIQACSFRIDVNTGFMWIIDAGRVLSPNEDDPLKSLFCPAKLVVIRVGTKQRVLKHEFPDSVIPAETNFLNDLILDYDKGKVAFVYMTDPVLNTMAVYNVERDISFKIQHPSMMPDPTAHPVDIGGNLFSVPVGLNGIAISCDFRYLYYSAFSAFDVYRIPLRIMRNGGIDFDANVESIGRRKYVSDAMIYSTRHILYFGAANESAIDRWLLGKDARDRRGFCNVKIKTTQRIAHDEKTIDFPDQVSISDDGYLYFTAARSNRVFDGSIDITGRDGTNYHIWRQRLAPGERSYLWRAKERTARWRKRVSARCH